MKTYTLEAVDRFIAKYIEKGGQIINIAEGSLGYGKILLIAEGMRSSIVNEVYLNEWSSGHTVRQYISLPKKYDKFV